MSYILTTGTPNNRAEKLYVGFSGAKGAAMGKLEEHLRAIRKLRPDSADHTRVADAIAELRELDTDSLVDGTWEIEVLVDDYYDFRIVLGIREKT